MQQTLERQCQVENELRDEILAFQEAVTGKTHLIEEKDQQLAAKDQLLVEKDQLLQEKEREKDELQLDLQTKEQEKR